MIDWSEPYRPPRYGQAPVGVTTGTHEVEYYRSDSGGSHWHPIKNPRWSASDTYRYRPRTTRRSDDELKAVIEAGEQAKAELARRDAARQLVFERLPELYRRAGLPVWANHFEPENPGRLDHQIANLLVEIAADLKEKLP